MVMLALFDMIAVNGDNDAEDRTALAVDRLICGVFGHEPYHICTFDIEFFKIFKGFIYGDGSLIQVMPKVWPQVLIRTTQTATCRCRRFGHYQNSEYPH